MRAAPWAHMPLISEKPASGSPICQRMVAVQPWGVHVENVTELCRARGLVHLNVCM